MRNKRKIRKTPGGTGGEVTPEAKQQILEAKELMPAKLLPPPIAKHGEHHFSAEQRALVREMAKWGVPFKDIAQQIPNVNTGEPISQSMLTQYFRRELDDGMAVANVEIGRSGYLQSVGWPAEFDAAGNCIRQAMAPVPMMTRAMLQFRLGYKETKIVENKDTELTTEAIGKALANLTYEDMLRVREIAGRARQGKSSDE